MLLRPTSVGSLVLIGYGFALRRDCDRHVVMAISSATYLDGKQR